MVIRGSVLYEFSIGRPIMIENLSLHFFGTPFITIPCSCEGAITVIAAA